MMGLHATRRTGLCLVSPSPETKLAPLLLRCCCAAAALLRHNPHDAAKPGPLGLYCYALSVTYCVRIRVHNPALYTLEVFFCMQASFGRYNVWCVARCYVWCVARCKWLQLHGTWASLCSVCASAVWACTAAGVQGLNCAHHITWP